METIANVKAGKQTKPALREQMLRKLEVGPYRNWSFDVEHYKELTKKCIEESKQPHRPNKTYTKGGGKKQRAEELKKLISEIDNI